MTGGASNKIERIPGRFLAGFSFAQGNHFKWNADVDAT
jgi:hypothetical protein